MLHIESFTFNPFSENTYILYNQAKEGVIIDPGMYNDYERKTVAHFISSENISLKAIINTHAHIDHILGINYIKEQYGVPFLMHQKEDIILSNALNSARMFGMDMDTAPEADDYLSEDTSYFIGEEELKILFTPGHSAGSITFYYPQGNWAISGDVLFHRSIGRTDLPTGNFYTLKESILTRLYPLPDNTVIYSGHGIPTTIGDEKRENPFVHL